MSLDCFMSLRTAVEFVDIKEEYSNNEDLHCTYILRNYTPQEGDRVAIYKLGWSYVKDYIVLEWAPSDGVNNQRTVVFNKHILPKNTMDLFQICYISGENEVQGVSKSLQFTSPLTDSCKSLNLNLNYSMLNDSCYDKSIGSLTKNSEVEELRAENEMLRASLKAVLAQKGDPDIRAMVEDLKRTVEGQQVELNKLKVQISQCGEEYKKVYIDKMHVERKYEKLRSKKTEKIGEVDEDILAGLKSIPPFPLITMNNLN